MFYLKNNKKKKLGMARIEDRVEESPVCYMSKNIKQAVGRMSPSKDTALKIHKKNTCTCTYCFLSFFHFHIKVIVKVKQPKSTDLTFGILCSASTLLLL